MDVRRFIRTRFKRLRSETQRETNRNRQHSVVCMFFWFRLWTKVNKRKYNWKYESPRLFSVLPCFVALLLCRLRIIHVSIRKWTVLPAQWVCFGHRDEKKNCWTERQSLWNSSEKYRKAAKCCMLCRSVFFCCFSVFCNSLWRTQAQHVRECLEYFESNASPNLTPWKWGCCSPLILESWCLCRSRCVRHICARCCLKLQLPNLFT